MGYFWGIKGRIWKRNRGSWKIVLEYVKNFAENLEYVKNFAENMKKVYNRGVRKFEEILKEYLKRI